LQRELPAKPKVAIVFMSDDLVGQVMSQFGFPGIFFSFLNLELGIE
jgi:hypothetical protein